MPRYVEKTVKGEFRDPDYSITRGGVRLNVIKAGFEHGCQYWQGQVVFVGTGEIREQLVAEANFHSKWKETVSRRIDQAIADSEGDEHIAGLTPQKLIPQKRGAR